MAAWAHDDYDAFTAEFGETLIYAGASYDFIMGPAVEYVEFAAHGKRTHQATTIWIGVADFATDKPAVRDTVTIAGDVYRVVKREVSSSGVAVKLTLVESVP